LTATADLCRDHLWDRAYCPLLAQSGHSTTEFRCPLFGG
jgi:hypothetical protein